MNIDYTLLDVLDSIDGRTVDDHTVYSLILDTKRWGRPMFATDTEKAEEKLKRYVDEGYMERGDGKVKATFKGLWMQHVAEHLIHLENWGPDDDA
jgi:hypothetical protein